MIGSTSASSSAPAGYRFPHKVTAVAVRWYLRYGLSYRDVEELLGERGVDVDHIDVLRRLGPPDAVLAERDMTAVPTV